MRIACTLIFFSISLATFSQSKPSFSGTFNEKKAKELITKNAKSLIEAGEDDSYRYDYTVQKTFTFEKDKKYHLVAFSGMPNHCNVGVWGYAVFEKVGKNWQLQSLDNKVSESEKMREIPEVKVEQLSKTEVKLVEAGKTLKVINFAGKLEK